MMELGATVCTPRAPQCHACPLATWCQAHRRSLAEKIPAPRKKPVTVRICIAAAVLLDPGGRTLLVHYPPAHNRKEDGLFSRMWQFPALTTRSNHAGKLREHLAGTFGIHADGAEPLPLARHSVTYRAVSLRPWLFRVASLPNAAATVASNGIRYRALRLDRLETLPVSNATRKIAQSARRALSLIPRASLV